MSEGIIIKSDGNKTIDQLRAEVAAFEANPVAPGAADVSTPPTGNAAATVTPEEKAAIPEPEKTPPAEETAKPAQQPKETAEKVASETPKAVEPVKDTDWKSAYEGLQRKYNKTFVERKAEPQDKPQAPTPSVNAVDDLTPEIEQRIIADLEKNPAKTLISLIREISRSEVNPIRSRLEADDFQKQEAAKLAGLDRLASEGHEWLKTADGLRKMEAVLTDNPELWKTKDPYRAALGFIPDIPSKAGQRGPAQSTGLTPILGASGALPPTVSTPAVSKMAKLETMQAEVTLAQSRGQWEKAGKLLAEMDQIERGY